MYKLVKIFLCLILTITFIASLNYQFDKAVYQCVDKKLYEKMPSDTYWKLKSLGCISIEQALRIKNAL